MWVDTRAERPPFAQIKLQHQNGSLPFSFPILFYLILLSQPSHLESSARSVPQFLTLSPLEQDWDAPERPRF